MRPWDGTDPTGRYPYPAEDANSMLVDGEGNVWYYTREKMPQLMIWCAASRLVAHLHRLEQIGAHK